jgi:hypothetical protein
MIKFKKQAKPVETQVSLADEIKAVCEKAEQYIEKRVEQLKNSEEGRSLPVEWLRLNIRATTRAGGCHCKCALALLDREKKQ